MLRKNRSSLHLALPEFVNHNMMHFFSWLCCFSLGHYFPTSSAFPYCCWSQQNKDSSVGASSLNSSFNFHFLMRKDHWWFKFSLRPLVASLLSIKIWETPCLHLLPHPPFACCPGEICLSPVAFQLLLITKHRSHVSEIPIKHGIWEKASVQTSLNPTPL